MECTHDKLEKTPLGCGEKANMLCLICGARNDAMIGRWRGGMPPDKWPVYPHLIERYWPTRAEPPLNQEKIGK